MTPERWREIERLYWDARKREPGLRQAYLAQACGADADILHQVSQLLAQGDSSGGLPDLAEWEATAAEPASAAVLETGTRLGPYEIAGALGEGGMGTVYRALDTRLNRSVAIKISARQFNQRFEREARAISALNHPNICTLYDVGLLPGGGAFLVAELVEGEGMREWLAHAPGLERALAVFRQVVEALRTAHDAGIVHRDLKPANIMVRFDGYAKVLDFGLAKRVRNAGATAETATEVTTPGQIVGTISYMAPEQILGQPADARSDVFALGIILYEMAAGRHPWPGRSSLETMQAILHEDPPPVVTPSAALERTILRCLRKRPELRFQTMADLAAALDEMRAEFSVVRAPKGASIAVLPFANMSADKENEYFGDGLAEEIINALAKVPGMLVAGRTSSFFFRGKDLEFAEIGRRLHVDHILEGSVRRAGNHMRVTAQLLKVSDGFQLWSERYDREATDIFAIQDEITGAIAAALRIQLAPRTASRRVPNLRAYEAFLEGRQHLMVRPSPSGIVRAKDLLERACELDPEFALPRSLLGGYYTVMASAGMIPARQAIAAARALEHGALRLDPSLPEAHAMLGVCAGIDYDWNGAAAHWHSALVVEPVPSDVRFWYGNHYLLPIGRAVEAAEVEAQVLQSDPLNLLYRRLYAIALFHTGRLGDAEAELRRILDVDGDSPASATLGLVCAVQQRFEEALVWTERAYNLAPGYGPVAGQLAALLNRIGDGARAASLVETLRSAQSNGVSVGLALYHALNNEPAEAAEWAGRAIEERYPLLVATLGPLLQPEPQWPALVKRMNLPA